jgi:hypothetical protein
MGRAARSSAAAAGWATAPGSSGAARTPPVSRPIGGAPAAELAFGRARVVLAGGRRCGGALLFYFISYQPDFIYSLLPYSLFNAASCLAAWCMGMGCGPHNQGEHNCGSVAPWSASFGTRSHRV